MTYIKKWYVGISLESGRTSAVLPVKKMIGEGYDFIIEGKDFDSVLDLRETFEYAVAEVRKKDVKELNNN